MSGCRGDPHRAGTAAITFTCAAWRRLRSKVGALRRGDNLVPRRDRGRMMHVPNVSDRDRALLRVLYQVRSDGLAAIVICSPVAGCDPGLLWRRTAAGSVHLSAAASRDPFGMKVLVTGDRGKVGVAVADHLRGCGHAVAGFDLAGGVDLRDLAAVKQAAVGCAAIVHLGGLAHDSAGTPAEIMAVNVLGTWHVLLAAENVGVSRVIHFSSMQALGIAEGERLPDYFPINDAHPRRAMRPYGLSKRLSEDLCEAFTARTGIATLSLRPVAVWQPETYAHVAAQRRANPKSESQPFWEYGAFVDVRDVAAGVSRAVEVRLSGHHRALLCATDIAGSAPSLELAQRLTPSVPIRSPERYRADPTRALVDCSAAETLLDWHPRHRWSSQQRGS